MILVTQPAIDKLKTLRVGDQALRISVQGGGCSGYTRKLEWVDPTSISDRDKLMVVGDDVKIVTDPKSHMFLLGSTLDFSDGLDGTGFTWSSPQAKKTCGCGSSFSV